MIYRKKYALAQKICESLRLPPSEGEEKIVKQWALSKVTMHHKYNRTTFQMITDDFVLYHNIQVREKHADGELLARLIVEKLQSSPCSVSFADIAKQAINNKKPALAALVSSCKVHVSA